MYAKPCWSDFLLQAETASRQLQCTIVAALSGRRVRDLNGTQAMLLFHVGDEEFTIGQLSAFYTGSNVSYNVKKLTELGYLNHIRSDDDRRAMKVSLTPKGKLVRQIIADGVAERTRSIGVSAEEISLATATLRRLETSLQRETERAAA